MKRTPGDNMIRLRVDVDQETWERLVEEADREKRPIPDHAAVTIRRAMGLPFPPPRTPQEGTQS